MPIRIPNLSLAIAAGLTFFVAGASAHELKSDAGNAEPASFDIVRTNVTKQDGNLIFRMETTGPIGAAKPTPTGRLEGSSVYAYVWPTKIDSAAVGFDPDQGILSFVLTSHPDFDDTPLYDENGDGARGNDGGVWHSHWVVLTPDEQCGPNGLKVRDIPDGAEPTLPKTWPGLPILLDSPGWSPELTGETVTVTVPFDGSGPAVGTNYDGVTSALRVRTNPHDPLLCVTNVFDVASGDLSLPGRIRTEAE